MAWWQRWLGRREVMGASEPARVASNPALEAAVEDALERGDARDELAVYGDWLASEGDPRGDLVGIQLQLEIELAMWDREHAPRTIEPVRTHMGVLASEAEALIARHQEHFLGRMPRELVEWHAGFWRSLRVPLHGDQGARRARTPTDLRAAMQLPSARFLRRLWLGSRDTAAVADLVPDVLPSTLRELYLGDFAFPEENELSWACVGDVGRLYSVVPRLERLVLQGSEIGLGDRIALPRLRSLEVISTHLPDPAIRAIAASELPELEQLVLWTGGNVEEPAGGPDALLALLATPFPKLRHLGIVNCCDSDAVVDALVRSPLLSQLDTLDLRLGTLTENGLRTLETARDRMRLSSLDLSTNYLAEGSRLLRLATKVVLTDQRQFEDDPVLLRYPAIAE